MPFEWQVFSHIFFKKGPITPLHDIRA